MACVGHVRGSDSDAGDVELTTLDLHTSEHAVTADGADTCSLHGLDRSVWSLTCESQTQQRLPRRRGALARVHLRQRHDGIMGARGVAVYC